PRSQLRALHAQTHCMCRPPLVLPSASTSVHTCAVCFFFNEPATSETYTLSLHDALPISATSMAAIRCPTRRCSRRPAWYSEHRRSEEHTSELQSPDHLVCRLLLEKKTTSRTY